LADNIRPAYLEIEELASGNIRLVWKVPRGQGLPPKFEPSFPEQFRIIPPRKRLKTNDAIVETWNMIGGDDGLAGAQIRIDGLKQTTTDALVRIRLSDGSVHHQKHVHYRCNTYKAQVIIKPTENYWKIVKIQLLDEQRVL